ncbi:hypothetical protein RB213_003371 [Colletotrichum asianum]
MDLDGASMNDCNLPVCSSQNLGTTSHGNRTVQRDLFLFRGDTQAASALPETRHAGQARRRDDSFIPPSNRPSREHGLLPSGVAELDAACS